MQAEPLSLGPGPEEVLYLPEANMPLDQRINLLEEERDTLVDRLLETTEALHASELRCRETAAASQQIYSLLQQLQELLRAAEAERDSAQRKLNHQRLTKGAPAAASVQSPSAAAAAGMVAAALEGMPAVWGRGSTSSTCSASSTPLAAAATGRVLGSMELPPPSAFAMAAGAAAAAAGGGPTTRFLSPSASYDDPGLAAGGSTASSRLGGRAASSSVIGGKRAAGGDGLVVSAVPPQLEAVQHLQHLRVNLVNPGGAGTTVGGSSTEGRTDCSTCASPEPVSALLKQQQQQLPPTGLPRRVLTEEQEQLQRKRSTELRHWERQLAQEQQRLDGCRTLLERELAKQTAAAAAAAAANATAAQDAAAAAATSRRASKGDKTANHAKPAPAAERAAVAFQNIMEEQPAAIAGSKRRSKGTPTAAAAAAAAAAEAEAASPPVDSGLAGVPLRVQLLSVAVLLVGMWLLGYWFGQSQGAAAACTATSGHVHMPSLEL